jgi:hypothetical protein
MFISQFMPFILQIIETYFRSTPNEDNKDSKVFSSESASLDSSIDKSRSTKDPRASQSVDSWILQSALDLLVTLLKKSKPAS